MKNSIKQKIQNSKVNFSGNLLKSLFLPLLIGLLAIIFTFTINFNRGMDFQGGIIVSLNAGPEVNLEDNKVYNEYKSGIEEVLNDNGVSGRLYTLEGYSIVVKIENPSSNKSAIIKGIKEDLVAKYYSDVEETELENRHLVTVSSFGLSVTAKLIITTFLASLISVLLIAIYLGFRFGLHSAVMAIVSSIGSVLFAGALIMVTRVQINTESLLVVPFVALLSVIMSFIYSRKVKTIYTTNDEFKNKSNIALCNEAVKRTLYGNLLASLIMSISILLVGIVNILNPIAFLSLVLFEGILSALYVNTFIMPAIFALSYVRKVKKEKQQEFKQTKKLSEEEIMKETDLDNLTSN